MTASSKRHQVMARSQALGHCVCDATKPCPCDTLIQQDRCPCAGERPPPQTGPVRLTQWVRNAGCASKISRQDLQRILSGLPELDDPRVVVGRAAGDDAGVMMLTPDLAAVLTVDVFTPPVDDPYAFGRIAAANSVSDIYAMGATPLAALSIIGFPIHDLPGEVMREILRGGIDCLHEAGVSVIGGHSLNDREIKAGFAVFGTCPQDAYIRNAGARPGDVLVITKPMGGGFLGFAHQLGRCPADALAAWTTAMGSLNRVAGEAMVRRHASAATDLTGFGILGHLVAIAQSGDVAIDLDVDALPLFPAVADLVRAEVWPGAVERNRESVDAARLDLSQLAPAQQALLYGPETSGGLMVFLDAEQVEGFRADCAAGQVDTWIIGQVAGHHAGGLIRGRTQQADRWALARPERVRARATTAPTAIVTPPSTEAPAMNEPTPSCCASTPTDAGACCATPPTAATGKLPPPAGGEAFKAWMAAVNGPGALDVRTKKLIALALSVQGKCEPCVHLNAKAARDAGASDAQLSEAVALGIAFGGAPTAMFYNKL